MKINSNIQMIKENNQAVIFDKIHLRSGILNETALFVWEMIKKGLSQKEIVKEMESIYKEVKKQQIENDVNLIFNCLIENGFILND